MGANVSTILKAGQAPTGCVAPAVFQMRDLLGEAHAVIAEAQAQAERIVADARSEAEILRESERQRGFECNEWTSLSYESFECFDQLRTFIG